MSSPGGYLDPCESWEDGLSTRLEEQLGLPRDDLYSTDIYHPAPSPEWNVKDCLSIWWRPNFDTFLVSKS